MPSRWRGSTRGFTRNSLLYCAMIDYWGDLVNYKQEKKMKAKIEINLNNDAFVEDPTELARVLRNLADDIVSIDGANLGLFIGVVDVNGNTVGQLEVLED